jgi:hypothetical protein
MIRSSRYQGCQFSWHNVPKRGEIYRITTKYTKRPLKNLPKLRFWSENKPSGNPQLATELVLYMEISDIAGKDMDRFSGTRG